MDCNNVSLEDKYITLNKLVETISFHYYKYDEARSLIFFYENYAKIVFGMSDAKPFVINYCDRDTINDLPHFQNERDCINFIRLKKIYYNIKQVLLNEDINPIILYGKGKESENELFFLQKKTIDFYFNYFFSREEEMKYLDGSPKILFSKKILDYIGISLILNENTSEMYILLETVRSWILKNDYIVGELKPFLSDCIPYALPNEIPESDAKTIWKVLK